jgi:hypothetical protein
MSELSVGSVTVPELLARLHGGRFLVPIFQREFVWTISQVEALADSVVRRRPIGMSTLWAIDEGEEDIDLPMGPVDIKDNPEVAVFGSVAKRGDRFAILDGRQRCTALAMAFGGLAPGDNRYKGAGRFFLSLKAREGDKWVVFKKNTQIAKENLGAPLSALAQGLMPLTIQPGSGNDWDPTEAWTKFMQALTLKDLYDDANRPADEENENRIARVREALAGVMSVRLATYTLGSKYTLADICEIFETLNTTGVQVSTVDLIHSFVYQETFKTDDEVSVREVLDEIGSLPGAIGWSSSAVKPERMAQIATATYIGLHEKPLARHLRGGKDTKVSSIKASDLLRTPTAHWIALADRKDLVAVLLGQFQDAVAGGNFPMKLCPYPATAAVYMGLAWSKAVEDHPDDSGWDFSDLASLFRAFFWRNALVSRYDQGFLSQVGTDIQTLRQLLRRRGDHAGAPGWFANIEGDLNTLIGSQLPSEAEVQGWCMDANESGAGARRDSMRLLLWTNTRKDLVSGAQLPPPGSDGVELHHLWPKRWIGTNKTGPVAALLKQAEEAGRDPVNAPANLVPLSAKSNQAWSSKSPGQEFKEKHVTFSSQEEVLSSAFIDKEVFDLLLQGDPASLEPALARRSSLLAKAIVRRTVLFS